MHIIHVRLSGGISKGALSGGPLHFNRLLESFSLQERVRISVITNDKDESVFPTFIKRIGIVGLSAISNDPFGLLLKLNFSFFRIRKQIFQLAKDESLETCSLILSESPFLIDLLATIYLSREYKVPAIVYFHHLTPPPWVYPGRRGFAKAIFKWLIETLSLTLVKIFNLQISLDNKRFLDLTRWKFESEILTHDGFLDWNSTSDNDKLNKHDNMEYDACFTGRIQESKGVEDLIYVWKKVVSVHDDAKLVIMGNSSTKFGLSIKEKVQKLNLEKNILFTGFVDEERKRSILGSSKLFIFPSYEEGWSLSVMEAVKYGCVPVVYDIPAYDYLGEQATRVKLGDRDGMAKEVLGLLQKDKSSLADINSIVLKEIKKYDIHLVTAHQLAFFKRLIGYSQ